MTTKETTVLPTSAPSPASSTLGSPQRFLLRVVTGFSTALTALLVTMTVLIDRQNEILADRSEAHGGFDPSVFPPFTDAIWLLANSVTALAIIGLLTLIGVLIATRTPRAAHARP